MNIAVCFLNVATEIFLRLHNGYWILYDK